MQKKSIQKKRNSKRRPYNNEGRLLQLAQTQEAVVRTYINLLVERKGNDVSMQELSKASSVPMRTLFRLFNDKQAIHSATTKYLASFLQRTVQLLNEFNLYDFIENTFISFDENEDLVMAYVLSPFGQEARGLFRKQFNVLLRAKIIEQMHPNTLPLKDPRFALIISLVNAKLWYDLRSDFGLSGKKTGKAVAWSVRTLLNDLSKVSSE